jgi:hypothetical protein
MNTKHPFTFCEQLIIITLVGALCCCIGFAVGYVVGYAIEYQTWLAHCSLVLGTHICGAP